jgi:hypothetical protein
MRRRMRRTRKCGWLDELKRMKEEHSRFSITSIGYVAVFSF